ncbi:LamG domain-containing protein [Kitasatospora terrestris]|uniref:LamG-like jellyroll fold domain-containing protein n=1 Tax=Kitasatospora terrestris TaxID=258051 RepID=A0ABP9DQQ0_9ACTN
MSDGGGVPGGGTPGWGGQLPTVTSAAPDWAALAEANEREHRRKRLWKIGGGAAAVLVVGALVATALAVSRPGGGERHDAAAPTAPVSAAPDGPAPDSAAPSASASGPASAPASPGASASASPSGSPRPGKSASAPAGATAPAPPAQLAGLTLGAGASVGTADGHRGPTLDLHGSADGNAQSGAPLVDTGKSFTVSAVVRNNAPTGARAVISQGTGGYYSFYLGRDYWGEHNQWVFKIQSAAGNDDRNVRQAFSTATATTGQWLLLTGVYDAGSKKISLYVNGALQQTTAVPGIWQTGGPTQIGRTRWKDQWTDNWDGAIADLQIWNQALAADAVGRLNASGGTSAGAPAAYSWLLP